MGKVQSVTARLLYELRFYRQLQGCIEDVRQSSKRDEDFLADKVATAHFYAEHILTRVPSLVPTITAGSSSVFSIDSSRIG